MNTRQIRRRRRAFTLVELLTVIAIIALLAAIIFPVFAAVREQARQSNTMSNLHNLYLGARLFHEDEGYYPGALFGYAETNDGGTARPAIPGDTSIVPIDQSTQQFQGTTTDVKIQGYLYREQVKDLTSFLCADNLVTDKSAVTEVYYPMNLIPMLDAVYGKKGEGYQGRHLVTWQNAQTVGGCSLSGDIDLPGNTGSVQYPGTPKLYYKMDSADIGPAVGEDGKPIIDPSTNQQIYELHYAPDWTHRLGIAANGTDDPCSDVYQDWSGTYADKNQRIVLTPQLKYKNPPTDRTVLTYITDHAATAGSTKIIAVFISGTARKLDVKTAYDQLPVLYKP